MKNKYLFIVDLDGTLLKNSASGEIHAKDKKAIKRAIDEGHVVCIATGRPWRATEKTYHELKLDTIVANYNGAQIHNPTDYNFNPYISYLNLNDVLYVLGDKKLKEGMTNLAIEGPGWVMLEKRDKDLERVFGFSSAGKFRLGIDFHKLPLKPTGIIFDTKKGINIKKLKNHLQRTYGDLFEFSSWSKGENLTPVFDMTNVGVTKAKAISLMARYYNVPMEQTVSIGDGYNDIPMFEVTEYSAAMGQSAEDIKKLATYISPKTNKEGGVGEFINKFLDDEDNSFKKCLKKKRNEIHNIKESITEAH